METLCCESADAAEAGGDGEGAAMVSAGAGTAPDLAPIPALAVAPRGAAGRCAQVSAARAAQEGLSEPTHIFLKKKDTVASL